MSKHTAARHAASRPRASLSFSARSLAHSTRVRALLSLGIFLGFGSLTTFAYFSDSVTISGTTFTSGTLDMTVNSEADDDYTWAALSLGDMVPGESRAASVTVQNVGTVPLTYTATATGSGALLPGLIFRIYVGGSHTNTTTNILKTGSCAGTQLGQDIVLTDPDQAVISDVNKQRINNNTGVGDDTQTLCVVAALPSTVGNQYQTTSAGVTLTLNALQLGAPPE